MTDAIYVTLGAKQLKEKPYKDQVKNFQSVDGENVFFYWSLTNKPKREFVNVFIVVGNKVRWKARFVEWIENEKIEFLDGSKRHAKIWMILIDFEKLPFPYKEKEGFQGFRYN